jgi:hypothetical protein
MVLLILAAAGTFVVGQQLSDLAGKVAPSASEEQRRLRAQLAIDAKVDELLGAAMDQVGADRALVYLAHNGKTDLTGQIPFLYLSVSNVQTRAGVAWKEAWSAPGALSTYSPLLRRVFSDAKAPRCARRDLRDPDLNAAGRDRMEARGIERSYVCPLEGAHGVVGLVAVEYLRRETVELGDAAVLERLGGISRHIHRAFVGG